MRARAGLSKRERLLYEQWLDRIELEDTADAAVDDDDDDDCSVDDEPVASFRPAFSGGNAASKRGGRGRGGAARKALGDALDRDLFAGGMDDDDALHTVRRGGARNQSKSAAVQVRSFTPTESVSSHKQFRMRNQA